MLQENMMKNSDGSRSGMIKYLIFSPHNFLIIKEERKPKKSKHSEDEDPEKRKKKKEKKKKKVKLTL
jgi:hypothetical protein